jgi:NADP-dependent 3-hydroxy acid dehydrogenase YdfG
LKRKNFSNKNIVITGASSGIGYALALELASQGANLILAARRKDRLQELAKRIESNGGQALVTAADVTKEGELTNARELAHKKFGLIDITIANAAIPMHGNFDSKKNQGNTRTDCQRDGLCGDTRNLRLFDEQVCGSCLF